MRVDHRLPITIATGPAEREPDAPAKRQREHLLHGRRMVDHPKQDTDSRQEPDQRDLAAARLA